MRVMQAALREFALSSDDTRRQFQQRPQPRLVLSEPVARGRFTFQFSFIDPVSSRLLGQLSAQTFEEFLDRFGEFVRGLPQPSMWGGPARRSPQDPFQSYLTRRMDQVFREVRRSPRATLSFRGRTIEVEGDRLEFK